jgi:hypothetical protein
MSFYRAAQKRGKWISNSRYLRSRVSIHLGPVGPRMWPVCGPVWQNLATHRDPSDRSKLSQQTPDQKGWLGWKYIRMPLFKDEYGDADAVIPISRSPPPRSLTTLLCSCSALHKIMRRARLRGKQPRSESSRPFWAWLPSVSAFRRSSL